MPGRREPHEAPSESASGVAQRLRDWAGSVLGQVPGVAFVDTPPSRDAPESRWVGLYPMALASTPGTRGAKAPPLQFGVRCLVTTAVADDLFELVFDAMERPDLEVEFEPLTAQGWMAFGVPPRPAIAIRLPMRRTRPRPLATAVRVPLVLAATPMVVLAGTVTGPGEIGVAGAKVELAGLGLSTQTDAYGRFRFAGVPGERALQVRVLARGSTQAFEPGPAAGLNGPLRLRMTFP